MLYFIKCAECGGQINIEPTEKTIICKACMTPFIFERTMFNEDMAEEVRMRNEAIERHNERLGELSGLISELETRREAAQSRKLRMFRKKRIEEETSEIYKSIEVYTEEKRRLKAEIRELMR